MSFKNTRRINKSVSPIGDRNITPQGNSKCINMNMKIQMDKQQDNQMSMGHFLSSLAKAQQLVPTITIDNVLGIEMTSLHIALYPKLTYSLTIIVNVKLSLVN